MENMLEMILARIKIPALAAFSVPLLLYGQPLHAQVNDVASFNPILEYCEQSKDITRAITLSQVITGSNLPHKDKEILLLLYKGMAQEELDYKCAEQELRESIKKR